MRERGEDEGVGGARGRPSLFSPPRPSPPSFSYNYLGLRATLPPTVEETLATPGALTQGDAGAAEAAAAAAAAAEAAALADPDVDCLWTVKDYLPLAVQAPFLAAVTDFVWLPWRAAAPGGPAAPPRPPSAAAAASQAAAAAAGGDEAAQRAWLTANLGAVVGRPLLAAVDDAVARAGADDGDPDHAFPSLAGSHLPAEALGTPALALARAACDAFSLDAGLGAAAADVRRNALHVARTREFAPAATFTDPCDTYILRGFTCGACGGAADLDLARDPALQAHRWACGGCAAPLDARAVEARLLDAVTAAATAYATQDLVYVKCRQVACGRLARACDQCGGGLALARAPAAAARELATLRRVARFQGFDALDEATSWLLTE